MQMFTLSPFPSCPFGSYIWIRELECFGEYQNQQHKRCCQMHFVVRGNIGFVSLNKSGVWNTSLLLWRKSVGTNMYKNIQCVF